MQRWPLAAGSGLGVRCWPGRSLLAQCVLAAGSGVRVRCWLSWACSLQAQACVHAASSGLGVRCAYMHAGPVVCCWLGRTCSLLAQLGVCTAGLVVRARCRLSWAYSLSAQLCVRTAQLCVLAAGSVVCAGTSGTVAGANASACAEAMPATVPLKLRLGFGTLTFFSLLVLISCCGCAASLTESASCVSSVYSPWLMSLALSS